MAGCGPGEADMITGRPGRTAARAVASVAVLLSVLGSAGCSRELEVSMSDPQTVTAGPVATATAEAAEQTPTDDAEAPPSDEPTVAEAAEAGSPTAGTKKPAWGGGTRVG